MEQMKIAKQMLNFQRTMFDNTYNTVTVMQDSSQNIIHGLLNQFTWVTEEAKKPLNDSATLIKKAREDFKKTINQGFDKIEELVDNKSEKTARKG